MNFKESQPMPDDMLEEAGSIISKENDSGLLQSNFDDLNLI